MNALVNAKLVTPAGIIDKGAVLFDRHIAWVGQQSDCDLGGLDSIIDVQGLYVGPGLIDVHIHGVLGDDASDATPVALSNMSKALPRYGVTAFLPTVVSAPWSNIRCALENIRTYQANCTPGAVVLGAHLEGPFLNPARAGAHSLATLRTPEFALIRDYLDVLRVVSLAPELPGGAEFLQAASVVPGLILAIGHSNATFDQAEEAIKCGISHAVHLFNAMPPLHHREPGVVGAILAHQLSAELIADDIHVHPGLYKVILRSVGAERLILVSDAMRGAGLGDGIFSLGDQHITVTQGSARLTSGQLAGSVLTLNQALRNFRRSTGVTLPEAIALASKNPAQLLGLSQKGILQEAMDADLIVFDEEIMVSATFVGGQLVHDNLT